jgi:uncharacterized protein YfaS (alpha-2-macroglobulin family)
MGPNVAVLDGGPVDGQDVTVDLDAAELTVVMSDGTSAGRTARRGARP